MLRPFPWALDLGAYHGLLGRMVAELPSVETVVYAESVFAYAERCPSPGHCLRRGCACRSRTTLSTSLYQGWRFIASTTFLGASCRSEERWRPTDCSWRPRLGPVHWQSCGSVCWKPNLRPKVALRRASLHLCGRSDLWVAFAAGRLRAACDGLRRHRTCLPLAKGPNARDPGAWWWQRPPSPKQGAFVAAHACPSRRTLSRPLWHRGRQGDRNLSVCLHEWLEPDPSQQQPLKPGSARSRPRRCAQHDGAAERRPRPHSPKSPSGDLDDA